MTPTLTFLTVMLLSFPATAQTQPAKAPTAAHDKTRQGKPRAEMTVPDTLDLAEMVAVGTK